MSEFVEEEIEQANAALSDAKILLDGGGSPNAVVNRLYYACFHAANAALLSDGHEATSHRGVLTLFGEEVVLAGDVPRDDGRFLNELNDYREQADYGYDTLDVEVHSLHERAEEFVERVATVAKRHGEGTADR